MSLAAFLRAEEAPGLTCRDISLPGEMRLANTESGSYGVMIREAESGPLQLVIANDPLSLALLRKHCPSLGSQPFKSSFPLGTKRWTKHSGLRKLKST